MIARMAKKMVERVFIEPRTELYTSPEIALEKIRKRLLGDL